jgi:antitoxin component of MazEF toxin-antitoxin module
MGDVTSLTKAATNTTSLRTTVPASIVKQFDLKESDQLEWVLVAKAEGKMGIEVIPKKA